MKIILKIILPIIIFILFVIIVKVNINNINTFKDKNEIPSSLVPKGTFKNTETGEIFDYIDGRGYLFNCQPNCKLAYFDIDSNGKIIQIRSTDENPIIGKVFSIILNKNDAENVDYVIDYQVNNKKYRATYSADLCVNFSGGSKQCYEAAHKGQQVIVTLAPNDSAKISYLTLFNKMLIAEVISITNVNHDVLDVLNGQ